MKSGVLSAEEENGGVASRRKLTNPRPEVGGFRETTGLPGVAFSVLPNPSTHQQVLASEHLCCRARCLFTNL